MKYKWSEWVKFPDATIGEYLYAPFGPGVYELYNTKTKKHVLFGHSKNVAQRMSSLLPHPLGCSTRNNLEKRKYVLENLNDIEYRTIAFDTKEDAKAYEKKIKTLNEYIFKT